MVPCAAQFQSKQNEGTVVAVGAGARDKVPPRPSARPFVPNAAQAARSRTPEHDRRLRALAIFRMVVSSR